jgi:hypothetical protein
MFASPSPTHSNFGVSWRRLCGVRETGKELS